MEYQQTDTEASGQSGIGIGRQDSFLRTFHETQPGWIVDGHGLRGPQEPKVRQQPARPEPMEFGVPTGGKAGFGSDPGPCSPTAPEDTGTFVWGSVDGVCQWIDTTDCTP